MANYTKNEPETIESLFNKIAPQYDRANSLMSLNLHKKWNKTLAKLIRTQSNSQRFLDLCCGTGEIAFETLQQIERPTEAFLLDFSKNMLDCARAKAERKRFDQHRLHYLHADVHQIPLPCESIDATTMAYGIRNVRDPVQCIQEVHRVLKKEGVFAILELTQPSNPIMKLGHKVYMKAFLPLIGKFVASDKQAYQYLCNSIQEFLKPIELASLLEKQGFHQIAIKPLNGGIATIVMGRKISD